jgi:anti-sigma B factor antagonist
VLMVRALSGRAIDWRGNDLGDRWRTEGAPRLERQAGDTILDEPVRSRMESTPDITTVMLPEHTDSTTAGSIEKTMLAALRPAGRLIVDGGAVAYMSAAGVRALATVLHQAEQQQTRVVLCNFSGAAADCLLVSGFSRLFDIAGSVEEARARLSPSLAGTAVDRLHPRGTTG